MPLYKVDMKNLEIRTITHKNIDVVIKIDYNQGTASLVELENTFRETKSNAKNWVFSKRGLEYMDSWLNILEAMSVAVKECKKELEKDLSEKSKFTEDLIIKAEKLRK